MASLYDRLREAFRALDEDGDVSVIREYIRGNVPLSGRVDIFLDTETSGMASYDKVIQLAYVVKYYPGSDDDESIPDDGIEIFRACDLINTQCKINPKAAEVHGITEKMLRGGEDRDAVYSRLKNACNLSRRTCGRIIAFNAAFDKRMMGDEFSKYTWECAMRILKTKGIKGKLGDIYEEAFDTPMVNAHDALGDVLAMIAVWEKYECHV